MPLKLLLSTYFSLCDDIQVLRGEYSGKVVPYEMWGWRMGVEFPLMLVLVCMCTLALASRFLSLIDLVDAHSSVLYICPDRCF